MNVNENPDLLKPVEPDTEVKNWLVEYVGEKLSPKDDEVTVEMIIKVVAEEFPEFLLPIAEENFIRGYQQAMNDVDEGEKLMRKDGLI
jgi:hypothetical protein|tara:strand:- start:21077 stop:21340 length:264 start_codon:yes stop_codon:yes gene_type:complete